MKIAIVHYHLGPGGVPRVITTASRVLSERGVPHVIIVGTEPDGGTPDLPVRVVPGSGYLTETGDLTPEDLILRLRETAFEALGSAPDLWHFHNHSLGRNPLLPGIVSLLAEAGERLLLHIHDLAEDGRPANHRLIAGCGNLYPIAPRVHYAFLNARDMEVFVDSGLPGENAGLIVNPVPPDEPALLDRSRPPIVFAPVRGIRRKNLGELVFLSALAPPGTRFAVSRAPSNPEAVPIHDAWRRFAQRQQLPIGFDVVDRFEPAAGAGSGFESWLAHATHFVTTSVSEGFGLPFLEAIACGKPLLGRNLPHITAEHARHQIVAGDLYDQLLIPVEWVDSIILREHLTTTLERNHRAYERRLSNEFISATFDTLVHDGWLDFGNLSESLQQGAIERLADAACMDIPRVRIRGEIRNAKDWLAGAIANRDPSATPDQLAPYSPAAYGEGITALYQSLDGRPAAPVTYLPPGGILTRFLEPASFHFLLSAPTRGTTSLPYRAVIFDIYGTLLIAPAGGVKPDADADPRLRSILEKFGHVPPASPSSELHAAVLRHHAAAEVPFPEIDLRVLWREVLSLAPDEDTLELVLALEEVWHPARPIPGAARAVQQLSRSGISLGLLSNAQCNTLRSLGGIADLFAPELTLLSYQIGTAKPSPVLFDMLADRLAGRGIRPEETLFIGNDPLQDIVPAAARGFRTALFAGHPDSRREGDCSPDRVIRRWSELTGSA